MNMVDPLQVAAECQGERVAIVTETRRLTYAQLFDAALRVARVLREDGIAPGDRVGVMLSDAADFATCFYGILAADAVAVIVPPWCKARETLHIIADAQCKAVVATAGLEQDLPAPGGHAEADFAVYTAGERAADGSRPLYREVSAQSPGWSRDCNRPAAILYTAAFDGAPMGAVLSHANLFWDAEYSARVCRVTPEDCVLCAIPVCHAFGLTCGINGVIMSGCSGYFLTKFDAQNALDLLAEARISIFLGVPTVFLSLLMAVDPDQTREFPALRLCISGGAALSEEIAMGCREAFGMTVRQGYGLTQASPVVTMHPPDGRDIPASCGRPLPGIEVGIMDETGEELERGDVGEIAVRGPTVMQGYWRRPTQTAQTIRAGWLRTGDLGYQDAEGYLYITGRKRHFIIRGGLNVYPREVERVLESHPAVAEARVVGEPDFVWGETVKAFVRLAPGARVTGDDLLGFAREQLAFYKRPRSIEVVRQLPGDANLS